MCKPSFMRSHARADRLACKPMQPSEAVTSALREGLLLRSLEEVPDGSTDLGAAIAEHRASLERRRTPEIIARRLKRGRFRPQADRDGQRDAAGEVARTAS